MPLYFLNTLFLARWQIRNLREKNYSWFKIILHAKYIFFRNLKKGLYDLWWYITGRTKPFLIGMPWGFVKTCSAKKGEIPKSKDIIKNKYIYENYNGEFGCYFDDYNYFKYSDHPDIIARQEAVAFSKFLNCKYCNSYLGYTMGTYECHNRNRKNAEGKIICTNPLSLVRTYPYFSEFGISHNEYLAHLKNYLDEQEKILYTWNNYNKKD